jgi:hypothetical protein
MAEPTLPTLTSELKFGSFLVYSPRGTSLVSRKSRSVCYNMKQDTGGAIAQLVDRLFKDFPTTALNEVLSPGVTFIPAPRSAPLLDGALWPARRIAEELIRRGLGADLIPMVTRTRPVQKSSRAQPGERTTIAEHLESLGLDSVLANPERITIVDDVVTKGRMLLAVATLLARRFPAADIRAFALVRTMGLQPEVERILAPCVGVIRRQWEEAVRYDDRSEPPKALF